MRQRGRSPSPNGGIGDFALRGAGGQGIMGPQNQGPAVRTALRRK